MTYTERFNLVKTHIITYTKEKITSRYHYCKEFNIWSYSAIKDEYKSKFMEEFGNYMTEDEEYLIWFAGYNISFAVRAFVKSDPYYTLSTLLTFVENFLIEQFDDFDNWCIDLCMAYPDDETTVDVNTIEDNPT